ncbi:hypothetical protein [Pontiella sulfatireligans]|uniref:Uncharacterized protein n=1 Tax=Pontiella sulfatireligans TaxID=2750658 RepID=A0A6C2UI87_9BACT|nr:hypothetical protein [Pontiella sulfatireligans]VGO19583.1 hypothetical protein SCARR_01642 [Pontiella sulfatireligans]
MKYYTSYIAVLLVGLIHGTNSTAYANVVTNYHDDFEESTVDVDLNGRDPDGNLSGTWTARGSIDTTGTNAIITDDSEALPSNATLPFSPEAGKIYALSADLNNNSSFRYDSVWLGFRNSDADTLFASQGAAARIYRQNGTNLFTVVTETPTKMKLLDQSPGSGTMKLLLDTTGTNWTLTTYWGHDRVGINAYSSAPDISQIGFGFSDGGGRVAPVVFGSTADNFMLTETTPAPTLTLLGDQFDGSPDSNINGRTADGVLGGTWSARESIQTTGTRATCVDDGVDSSSVAALAFSPEAGNIYTLSADLYNLSSWQFDSVWLGFTSTGVDSAFSGCGTAARIYRESQNTGYTVVKPAPQSKMLFKHLQKNEGTMKLVLDTTGTNWVLSTYWNESLLGTDTFESAPDIQYASFGFSGGGETTKPLHLSSCYVDNFSLTMAHESFPPAEIIAIESVGMNQLKLIVHADRLDLDNHSLVGCDDLVIGSWNAVHHSDDGTNAFVITNLSYSTLAPDGSNAVIYVQATNNAGFFNVD